MFIYVTNTRPHGVIFLESLGQKRWMENEAYNFNCLLTKCWPTAWSLQLMQAFCIADVCLCLFTFWLLAFLCYLKDFSPCFMYFTNTVYSCCSQCVICDCTSYTFNQYIPRWSDNIFVVYKICLFGPCESNTPVIFIVAIVALPKILGYLLQQFGTERIKRC